MMWLCVFLACATARRNVYPYRHNNLIHSYRRDDKDFLPTEDGNMIAVFPPLRNIDVNATAASETQYPWVARVVLSRTRNNPHMCTAICISRSIFITAATCVLNLKIEHTTVIYNGQWLRIKAMVVPEKLSRQGFDDIGFLVAFNLNNVKWHTLPYTDRKRTDNRFNWYKVYKYNEVYHTVIGYSTPSIEVSNYYTDKQFYLSELPVVVNSDLCPRILPPRTTTIYDIPCYHTCTAWAAEKNENWCNRYHGVVGGALIHTKDVMLIGVATWGPEVNEQQISLPVGFAMPNSDNFHKDYKCAIKIRDDIVDPKPGHYQSLCK